jgi:hypothetical protein
MIGGAITRNYFSYTNIDYFSYSDYKAEIYVNYAFILFSENFFGNFVEVFTEPIRRNAHMTFNGNRLVDSLASDFGPITSRADKLFY